MLHVKDHYQVWTKIHKPSSWLNSVFLKRSLKYTYLFTKQQEEEQITYKSIASLLPFASGKEIRRHCKYVVIERKYVVIFKLRSICLGIFVCYINMCFRVLKRAFWYTFVNRINLQQNTANLCVSLCKCFDVIMML